MIVFIVDKYNAEFIRIRIHGYLRLGNLALKFKGQWALILVNTICRALYKHNDYLL